MFSRQTVIAILSGAWLAGVAFGQHIHVTWWAGLTAALVGMVIWRYRPRAGLVVVMLAALLAGAWRAQPVTQIGPGNLVGQKPVVQGVISSDPTTTNKGMTFTIETSAINGRPVQGTWWVYTYPQRFQRGYELKLQGKLEAGFGPYSAELFYPKTLAVNTHQTWLEQWRQKFFAGVRTALPEPLASFVLGLLIGVRALIPKSLQTELARTGLSHLVAVSGYNLTIIAQASHRFTSRLGYNVSGVITLWLIAGFVVVTGAPASIVRAAVVAVLVLAADRYGRRIIPLNLLLLAAVATTAWHPFYLSDLGWLLSFTAFFGIAVLAPAVESRLGLEGEVATPGVGTSLSTPKQSWRLTLIKLLIESVCAQLMTLPLLMHNFSQLSIIAPVANLIILPLVPLAMLTGFVAGLAGMWLPAFCGWLAWPAQLVTWIMLSVIHWLNGLHYAELTQSLSAADTVGSYLLLAVLTTLVWRAAGQNRPAIVR